MGGGVTKNKQKKGSRPRNDHYGPCPTTRTRSERPAPAPPTGGADRDVHTSGALTSVLRALPASVRSWLAVRQALRAPQAGGAELPLGGRVRAPPLQKVALFPVLALSLGTCTRSHRGSFVPFAEASSLWLHQLWLREVTQSCRTRGPGPAAAPEVAPGLPGGTSWCRGPCRAPSTACAPGTSAPLTPTTSSCSAWRRS